MGNNVTLLTFCVKSNRKIVILLLVKHHFIYDKLKWHILISINFNIINSKKNYFFKYMKRNNLHACIHIKYIMCYKCYESVVCLSINVHFNQIYL